MNNIIIAGSLFTYAAVFLLGVDTRLVDSHRYELLCYVFFNFMNFIGNFSELRIEWVYLGKKLGA